jgi:hypothetical protein
LGLGNPNKTAALIATLMIAVWALAYIRRWGFWLALGLFTVLGGCLVHTFSRGGMVAMAAGAAILLCYLPRPWKKARIFAVSLSIWVMVGYAFFLSAHERYVQSVGQTDESVTNRPDMWATAPAMMVDAPGGWGLGNSGSAYMNWYQTETRLESYRTLVSSHLTWLVELGWPLRFLYLAGWGAIFLLCWPTREQRWLAVPLGVWLAFGIAVAVDSTGTNVSGGASRQISRQNLATPHLVVNTSSRRGPGMPDFHRVSLGRHGGAACGQNCKHWPRPQIDLGSDRRCHAG